jgi:hypothetical protein
MKVVVLRAFRDLKIHSIVHSPGEVIENFDDERVKDLLLRKLVIKFDDIGKKPGGQTAEADIDLSGHHLTIISQVKAFGDIQKLKSYLAIEKAKENPRESVAEAIESRINDLETALI